MSPTHISSAAVSEETMRARTESPSKRNKSGELLGLGRPESMLAGARDALGIDRMGMVASVAT
jgi:hypothetical protein